jgi:thioredoxin 1
MSTFIVRAEEELEKIIDGHETVVLDFWAEWCAPCRGFGPVFDAVAKQNTDMAFCRVNIEEAEELERAFEVDSIPALVIIKDSVLVVSHVGYMDEKALSNVIEQVRALDMDTVRKQVEADADS